MTSVGWLFLNVCIYYVIEFQSIQYIIIPQSISNMNLIDVQK